MEKEKTISVLNTLITINNDRIEGYDTASKETEEQFLKVLFAQLKSTSQKCNVDLEKEVKKLGGTPAEGTKITGKFFRVWMDVKAALTNKDIKAILNSCEYGEDMAKKTYQDVLADDAKNLSSEVQSMIKSQYALLVVDHDEVKSMRDKILEVK